MGVGTFHNPGSQNVVTEMEGFGVRWKVYNLAFCLFGKTFLWPRLGFILWR